MITKTDANNTPQKIDSFQRRHFHKIQTAYRCINTLNIVIVISLLLLLKFTGINAQIVYLVLAVLPLDIYVFSWIFHEVVTWKAPDKTESLSYKFIYLGFPSPLIVLFFVDLSVLFATVFSSFQCVHGDKYLLLTTVVICIVLIFVSVLLLPRHMGRIRGKLEAYITIVMFSILISWTLTEAVFYAASEPTDLYAAVVLDSYKSYSRGGTNYYVSVQLRDGEEQRLYTYKDMYDYTQEHKAVLIRERTSFFGTTFVSVHNPLTYMEEYLDNMDAE